MTYFQLNPLCLVFAYSDERETWLEIVKSSHIRYTMQLDQISLLVIFLVLVFHLKFGFKLLRIKIQKIQLPRFNVRLKWSMQNGSFLTSFETRNPFSELSRETHWFRIINAECSDRLLKLKRWNLCSGIEVFFLLKSPCPSWWLITLASLPLVSTAFIYFLIPPSHYLRHRVCVHILHYNVFKIRPFYFYTHF